MRLKLVFIASLPAAIIGAGSGIAFVYWTIGRAAFVAPQLSRTSHGWLNAVLLLPPLILALAASFFVYRHTALRRKLQAILTFLLAMILSLAIHMVTLLVLYH